MKRLLLLILIFVTQEVLSQPIDYKGLPQWTWHKEDSTEYYLYTPSNMEAGKKYPVALAMHGCCGETYHATLRNTVDPVVRMWHNFGANTQTIPTYIIAPATSRGWQQHFTNLKKVMDDLIAHQNADPQRIYVCGFSMGGDGTFKIILQYPGYFAAAITMGMSFRGDSTKVKDIPIWANQGETDYYSRSLRKNVEGIRHLNGYTTDTGNTWVTGVNPRYSNFNGVDHGVQWDAASKQDLTGWAYSKINDGNIYPVVFFEAPSYKQIVKKEDKVTVTIHAHDPDGTIAKVEVYMNEKPVNTLSQQPYSLDIIAQDGNNTIKAIAYDNRGKQSFAAITLTINIPPAITTKSLKKAKVAAYYTEQLKAVGNGDLQFFLKDATTLPKGLLLYPEGTIKGIPTADGNYSFTVWVKDEDNDSTEHSFQLSVEKNKGVILVSNVVTTGGKIYPVSKLMFGESPNFNSKDSTLTANLPEINFSKTGKYDGLTYIKTDINDADTSLPGFLSFDISKDATVYIAYEKLDSMFHSTIPAWLTEYKKEEGEIIAQYRYYDVYSKNFPKGKVVLPAADARTNNITTGYFVMIKINN